VCCNCKHTYVWTSDSCCTCVALSSYVELLGFVLGEPLEPPDEESVRTVCCAQVQTTTAIVYSSCMFLTGMHLLLFLRWVVDVSYLYLSIRQTCIHTPYLWNCLPVDPFRRMCLCRKTRRPLGSPGTADWQLKETPYRSRHAVQFTYLLLPLSSRLDRVSSSSFFFV
jgi:hypothetical protein